MESPLLTVRETCAYLRIGNTTLYRWFDDKSLNFPKPIKFVGKTMLRKSDIDAWLDAQQQQEGAA